MTNNDINRTFCTHCGNRLDSLEVVCKVCSNPVLSPATGVATSYSKRRLPPWLVAVGGIAFALVMGFVVDSLKTPTVDDSLRKTVRIKGDSGVPYSETCVIWLGGSAHSEQFSSTIPNIYVFHAELVSCSFQKGNDDRRYLRLEITKGDNQSDVSSQRYRGTVWPSDGSNAVVNPGREVWSPEVLLGLNDRSSGVDFPAACVIIPFLPLLAPQPLQHN